MCRPVNAFRGLGVATGRRTSSARLQRIACGAGTPDVSKRQRRRSESNRRIEVLQTSALPLGYGAGRNVNSQLTTSSARVEGRIVSPEWPVVNTTGSEPGVVIVRANSGSALSQRVDSCAQHRHELPLKPGMTRQPRLIARRGVGQRHVLGSVLLPGPGRFGQRPLAAVAQKVALSILTDEQSQFNPGQPGQQLIEP